MKVTKTVGVAAGLAVMFYAGLVFLGVQGAGNFLRGGSQTKPLGARVAARRALLKALAYSTKTVNRRRLQETTVDCSKINTLGQDALECIYPSQSDGQTGNQAYCFGELLVEHGVFSAYSAALSLLEKSSDLLNAEQVAFPPEDAVSITNGLTSICTAHADLAGNSRGLSTVTQEAFVNQATNYYKTDLMSTCLEWRDTPTCDDFGLVVEVGLSLAHLG